MCETLFRALIYLTNQANSGQDSQDDNRLRDYLDSFVCGMSPSARKHRRFCMLAGYYDDSCDSTIFAVGGLVNAVSVWKSFTVEWQRKLDEFPAIEYYKASEARVRSQQRLSNNQFRNLSEKQVLEKEKLLAKIIADHKGYAVFSLINRADFQSIVLPRVGRRNHGPGKYTGHEYHFPFWGCVLNSVKYLRQNNIEDQIDFFFDEQGSVGKWARDMYEYAKKNDAFRDIGQYLGVCVPHDDKEIVALQAADLIASQSRRWSNQGVAKVRGDATSEVMDIIADLPVRMTYWHADDLRKMVDMHYPSSEDSNLRQ